MTRLRLASVTEEPVDLLTLRAAKAKAETDAIGREAVQHLLDALTGLERASTLAAGLDMVPVGIRELATRWAADAVERSQTVGQILTRVKP